MAQASSPPMFLLEDEFNRRLEAAHLTHLAPLFGSYLSSLINSSQPDQLKDQVKNLVPKIGPRIKVLQILQNLRLEKPASQTDGTQPHDSNSKSSHLQYLAHNYSTKGSTDSSAQSSAQSSASFSPHSCTDSSPPITAKPLHHDSDVASEHFWHEIAAESEATTSSGRLERVVLSEPSVARQLNDRAPLYEAQIDNTDTITSFIGDSCASLTSGAQSAQGKRGDSSDSLASTEEIGFKISAESDEKESIESATKLGVEFVDTKALESRPSPYVFLGKSEDRAEACRLRGNKAFERRDFVAASRLYKEALESQPSDAMARNNLAACLLSMTPPLPAEALKCIAPLISPGAPINVRARERAGRCCTMLGKLEEAIVHLDAAVETERAPRAVKEPIWGPPALSSLPRPQGVQRLDGPSISNTQSAASKARATARRLLNYCSRAQSLGAMGRTDEALYLARSVTRACTHNPRGVRLVIDLLEAAGRVGEALNECDEALEAFPSDCHLRFSRARLLGGLMRHAEAGKELHACEQMLAGELVGACEHESAEKLRHSRARISRALTGFREAQTARADGNSAYDRGDFEKAAAFYSDGIESDVEFIFKVALLGNRAQAKLKMGRPGEALKDVEGSLKVNQSSVKLMLRQAACLMSLRRFVDARATFEKIARLEDCDEVRTGIKECDAHLREQGDSSAGPRGTNVDDMRKPSVDPYKLLGLSVGASATEVKQAFRRAALKWHPDKIASVASDAERAEAEANFKLINLSNAVLSDPVMRRRFDAGARLEDLAMGAKSAYS